jgi:hypothetical protein
VIASNQWKKADFFIVCTERDGSRFKPGRPHKLDLRTRWSFGKTLAISAGKA